MRRRIKRTGCHKRGAGFPAESAGFPSFRGLACHEERFSMSYCLSVGLKGGNGKEKLSRNSQSLRRRRGLSLPHVSSSPSWEPRATFNVSFFVQIFTGICIHFSISSRGKFFADCGVGFLRKFSHYKRDSSNPCMISLSLLN